MNWLNRGETLTLATVGAVVALVAGAFMLTVKPAKGSYRVACAMTAEGWACR